MVQVNCCCCVTTVQLLLPLGVAITVVLWSPTLRLLGCCWAVAGRGDHCGAVVAHAAAAAAAGLLGCRWAWRSLWCCGRPRCGCCCCWAQVIPLGSSLFLPFVSLCPHDYLPPNQFPEERYSGTGLQAFAGKFRMSTKDTTGVSICLKPQSLSWSASCHQKAPTPLPVVERFT